jgi:predicted GH43/DUF377 family glycosyl hydrolase
MFFYSGSKGKLFYLGYAKLEGPTKVVQRNTEPLVVPSTTDEIHGIDPRIVIDSIYYLTYCAYL